MSKLGRRFSWEREVLASDLDSSAKFLAIVIATYTSASQQTAFPTQAALAVDCSISPRSVRRLLGVLKEAGFITVERSFRKDGGKRASDITLGWPSMTAIPREKRPPVTVDEVPSGEVEVIEAKADTHVHPHRTPMTYGDRTPMTYAIKGSTDQIQQTSNIETPAASNGAGAVQELVAWWVDRQIVKPAPADVGKQGAVAKRLIAKYGTDGVRMAVAGMGHLFPHSNGEPWDLMDLERKFLKAAQALVTSDPRTKAQSARNRILDRIKEAR